MAAESSAKKAGSAFESPAYTGSNATLAMLFRKATKRDPTTRVKALQEISQFLQFPSEGGPSAEQVTEAQILVAHLAYLYSRMCFDSDRLVRSALNSLLRHVVCRFVECVCNSTREVLSCIVLRTFRCSWISEAWGRICKH